MTKGHTGGLHFFCLSPHHHHHHYQSHFLLLLLVVLATWWWWWWKGWVNTGTGQAKSVNPRERRKTRIGVWGARSFSITNEKPSNGGEVTYGLNPWIFTPSPHQPTLPPPPHNHRHVPVLPWVQSAGSPKLNNGEDSRSQEEDSPCCRCRCRSCSHQQQQARSQEAAKTKAAQAHDQ